MFNRGILTHYTVLCRTWLIDSHSNIGCNLPVLWCETGFILDLLYVAVPGTLSWSIDSELCHFESGTSCSMSEGGKLPPFLLPSSFFFLNKAIVEEWCVNVKKIKIKVFYWMHLITFFHSPLPFRPSSSWLQWRRKAKPERRGWRWRKPCSRPWRTGSNKGRHGETGSTAAPTTLFLPLVLKR